MERLQTLDIQRTPLISATEQQREVSTVSPHTSYLYVPNDCLCLTNQSILSKT